MNDSLCWRKSSYSNANGNCVEIAVAAEGIAVRDSKDPNGPVISISRQVFTELRNNIRNGLIAR